MILLLSHKDQVDVIINTHFPKGMIANLDKKNEKAKAPPIDDFRYTD